MRKREDRRKLVVKRERLRELTALTSDEARQVAGGVVLVPIIRVFYPDGRIGSRCC